MKSECIEYQGKIARKLLEDLTADEQQALEAHIAVCPQCQSEQESYSRTLDLMQSMDNEPAPRHFFVQPQELSLNPWEFFRMLKPRWQAITAAVAGLFLLASVGGVLGFSRRNVDVAELKKEFLAAAEEQNRRTAESFLQEVRAEISRSRTDLTQRQKTELTAALDRIDTRMTGRLKLAESRVRDDAQKMAVNVYQTVSQQRAQDLNLINLRFDGIETKNAIETRQNDAILSTLLQVSEITLK
jgi:hypothetical protein